ncbi:hypothetical protein [Streptomyces sp. NBC_01618]|uniref:hypothetical protein n=1 Tax=Streptomyces sp. NBC_01618 TaxID=2975900 RepID=UPI0038676F47|nr:hypothetical protein OH735_15510 [Streptomyces sp. NBC_01618]
MFGALASGSTARRALAALDERALGRIAGVRRVPTIWTAGLPSPRDRADFIGYKRERANGLNRRG